MSAPAAVLVEALFILLPGAGEVELLTLFAHGYAQKWVTSEKVLKMSFKGYFLPPKLPCGESLNFNMASKQERAWKNCLQQTSANRGPDLRFVLKAIIKALISKSIGYSILETQFRCMFS